MPVRQIGHQFGHHLKADEKAVQRILVELVGAGEQFVEQRILALHVADEQRLGELVLVLEMIEEAALGDADLGDHLLDRGGGEALLEHGSFRHVENALSCIAALARCLLHSLSCSPADCTTGPLESGPGRNGSRHPPPAKREPIEITSIPNSHGVHRKSPGRRSEESSPY